MSLVGAVGPNTFDTTLGPCQGLQQAALDGVALTRLSLILGLFENENLTIAVL